MKYVENDIPLVIIGGKEYGSGSSRDWAAKGTNLLGVKAVIAESYERIHRSNLVQMGVLPLQFKDGDTPESLGLDGSETFNIELDDNIKARGEVKVTAVKENGDEINFTTNSRIDTPVEVDYYRNGGILHTVLLDYLKKSKN
jgi:aconitate hydratase